LPRGDLRGNEIVYFVHRQHLPCNQNLAFSLTPPTPELQPTKLQPWKVSTLPADGTGD